MRCLGLSQPSLGCFARCLARNNFARSLLLIPVIDSSSSLAACRLTSRLAGCVKHQHKWGAKTISLELANCLANSEMAPPPPPAKCGCCSPSERKSHCEQTRLILLLLLFSSFRIHITEFNSIQFAWIWIRIRSPSFSLKS